MGGVCCKSFEASSTVNAPHVHGLQAGAEGHHHYPDPVRLFTPTGRLAKSEESEGPLFVHSSTDGGAMDMHLRRRSSSSQRPAEAEPPWKGEEDACCLAWMLSTSAHARAGGAELARLHEHIRMCVRLVGAQVLMNEATSGLIWGAPPQGGNMSDADTTLRCGQLLCRWAAANQLGLQVGVHVGSLHCLQLPDGGSEAAPRRTYFGSACAQAIHLATMAEQRWMVHLSKEVKQRLNAFRLVRLLVSPHHDTSYYLDSLTVVKNYYEQRDTLQPDAEQDSVLLDLTASASLRPHQVMPLHEFQDFLSSHGVDVSKFGVGSAKTIEQFYNAVVKEHKAHLEVNGGMLERVVHLVRVSLRIRDGDNKLRELRVASQTTAKGTLRPRDQPLAVVLKSPEKDRWQDAVEKCFEEKLNLCTKVQKNCFVTDMDSYSYKEDRSASQTIPGIITTYKAHNIVINIKDKTKKDLRDIGLPSGSTFSLGTGPQQKNWTWAIVGNSKEEELMSLLQAHGVDASDFAAQAFAELYDEVYERALSTLEVQNGELVRTIRIIKVWLRAQVLNVDHVLLVKAKWQKGQFDAMNKDQPISMRMSVDQEWEEAVEEALLSRLGLAGAFQREHLSVDTTSHKLTEETAYSRSYPGLKTMYVVNEVTVSIVNSEAGACHLLGLPVGNDFTFSRREALKGPGTEDVVITHWSWKHIEGYEQQQNVTLRRSVLRAPSMSDLNEVEEGSIDGSIDELATVLSEDEVLRRRVPRPKPLKVPTAGPKDDSSVAVLTAMMKGRKTDWERARNAAARILDPTYTCKDYYEDITAAFPELRLYCITTGDVDRDEKDLVSSGRTADDEYQRTIGALFAVFWIMRLDLDGKESFCFGLDNSWQPRSLDSAFWTFGGRDTDELPKRQTFYDKADWKALQKLLMDAGLIRTDEQGLHHDQEHTLAMLVMMAIHDIMKLNPLLPSVDKKVKEFCGYKAGELISDHDVALSYVLVHHPELLPSYAGLGKSQQDSVRFTHCKMEYNMGWLVQAEAPPGALFRTFRSVVAAGQATNLDIAFYFVHWFVDLAGAEPCPLEGCEKFVLRFPQRVLGQFLDSFSVVQGICSKGETEIVQDYLVDCWSRHRPSLGPPPWGAGAVAKMRLVLMAQGDSEEILGEFEDLSREDRETLSQEMACTGCRGQQFALDDLAGTPACGKGPAILVYYGPALMQKAGRRNPKGALTILAEVYRQTRELWRFTDDAVDQTVTVRIDALKELECSAVLRPDSGQAWVISKTSGKDAMVKMLCVSSFKDIDWRNHQALTFAGQHVEKRKHPTKIATTVVGFIPRVKRFSVFRGYSS